MTHWITGIFLTLLLLITSPARAIEATQPTCPVMLGNPIDPSLHVEYEGQKIYFCCKMCVSMFNENPQEYLKNISALAAPVADQFEEVPHDHTSDHGQKQPNKLISFTGKFHPLAVHLPIALFLVAALAELLFLLTGVPLFRSAARFNLWIAVPATLFSILLGLAIPTARFNCEYAQILEAHRLRGFGTLGIGIGTLILSEMAIRSYRHYLVILYRIALLISALAIGATAHLGGLLVYGLNHFSW